MLIFKLFWKGTQVCHLSMVAFGCPTLLMVYKSDQHVCDT